MRTARKTSVSNLYRVAVRAETGRTLFVDSDDRKLFLDMIASLPPHGVEVLAWCLTDSCVQLVLWADLAVLSKRLRDALSSYARSFNRRHGTTGKLYRDRFFSEPIETDDQLLGAVCAVHLHPLQTGEASTLKYGWSSYREYFGAREICNTVPALGAAGGRSALRNMHRDFSDTQSAPLPRARVRISDEEAADRAECLFGPDTRAIAQWAKADRNDALRALRSKGLSGRQITELTGVGRGVIEKL